jgi:hypothetical protein
MAVFPKCEFQLLLPNGVVTSGTTVEGILEVTAPEPIPRAEHIDLFYRTKAWAGYGGGKNRRVIRRDMLIASLRVDLPAGQPMPAGTFRYPFRMDVPAWVPPSFFGSDCAIENIIETRLDVDWAKDPVSVMRPVVVVPPAEGVESPLVVRSPAYFHESIVLEVTLSSSVVTHGHPFIGHVALRGGHNARFDAVLVTLASVAQIAMGAGDTRRGAASTVRIPAERLRRGESVQFLIPQLEGVPNSFRNGFLDHSIALEVAVDIPWGSDPSFAIPLLVLPPSSTLHPSGSQEVVVGAERLQLLSTLMAQDTGLARGRLPVLVEGAVAGIVVRITDGPRGGRIGIDVDLEFPDVELGLAFRPLGMLDGFRDSPLLPPALRVRYLLRSASEDARPKPDDAVVAAFAHAALDELGAAEEVRFSDHHLGAHFPLATDGSEQLLSIARFACAKARAIADAIAAMPFPASVAQAQAAWQATAREQNAFLVPTGPALRGLVFRTRIVGSEERIVGASIRTTFEKDGPKTIVDVDLRATPLPKSAGAELANVTSERLRSVAAIFPTIHAPRSEHAILERPGFTDDPRTILPAIEAFVGWVLESRGERRADAPYR